jgi:PilZ domain-containing protein
MVLATSLSVSTRVATDQPTANEGRITSLKRRTSGRLGFLLAVDQIGCRPEWLGQGWVRSFPYLSEVGALTIPQSRRSRLGLMSGEGRKFKRRAVYHSAMIYGTNGARLTSCVVRNVSVGGAQIELQREVELPKTFLLSLSENGQVRRRCKIVWRFSTAIGVSFAAA